MTRIGLHGVKEALRGLRKYANPYRKQLMRKALRAAGRYLLALAKLYVPKNSQLLFRSLTTRMKYYAKNDVLVLVMGPKSWATTIHNGRKQIAHKYAHLAEDGRSAVVNRKLMPMNINGRWLFRKHVRAAAGQPFVKRSVRVGGGQALDEIRKVVAAGFNNP